MEMLSDDVLLEIFDLCLDKDKDIDPCARMPEMAICRVCIATSFEFETSMCKKKTYEDNIIAALEHRDRVCEIKLDYFARLQSEKLVPLMQQSFPALTKLQILGYPFARGEPVLVLPDSFLGGSAPHLRFLYLGSISFPAFPNLLLFANNLVYLSLFNTPSGYISPDSALKDPAPLSPTRSVLPALKRLELQGTGEYLDDFVARIDVPSMNYLKIVFTNRPFFVNDFFHLPQFIGRVEKFRSFNRATFDLAHHVVDVTLLRTPGSLPGTLQLIFLCDAGGPLPSLVKACNTSLLPLSNVENFDISTQYLHRDSQSGFNTEDPKWLELLRQFSPAKSLSLGSMHIVPPVAFALKQVIEEGMADVLRAIQDLSVSGSLSARPVREAIEQFAAVRGLSVFETPERTGYS